MVSASAGSGKTFALTWRYIQLLLSDRNPYPLLRNLLAITFTNNAAKEMRQRVLTYLRALSLGDPVVLAEAERFLSGDPPGLQQRADLLLQRVFDNYADFQVRTIDSFVSTVFRASSLEFGFDPNFEILLAKDSMVDEAFDLFAKELPQTDLPLLDQLVELITQTRSRDASYLWDPYSKIAAEVKGLFSILASQPKNEIVEDLSSKHKELIQRISTHAAELESLLRQSGLPTKKLLLDDLNLVRSGDFNALLKRAVRKEAVNKPKTQNEKDASERWGGKIAEALETLNAGIRDFTLLSSRSFYQPYLRAISMVRATLLELKRQEGVIFIEDVNKMLVRVLNQQAVPDVYLALGDTIYHYLIDEFQDTSPIQWSALKPLVENSLSLGGSLFVVGDMKQSIYGFRGADWTIMKRMSEGKEFPSAGYQQIPLDTNWRSHEKIIRFTEDVFRIASSDDEYAQAAALTGLSPLHHRVKDEHLGKGYVEVRRVPKDDQQRTERTPVLSILDDCHKRGYQWKDIAVLTQDNDDVVEISRWLNEQRIPFISHSNLDIRTRKVVAELIALLKFLDSPIDSLSFFTFLTGELFTGLLAKQGQRSLGMALLQHMARTGRSTAGREPLYKAFRELHPGLWEEYIDTLYRQVGYLPLYDLLSGIYATFTPFEILPGEEGALAKLLDVVRTFEEQGSNSIKDFIAFATTAEDESGWQMDAPADVDAVSLMTIHKAKGLERPVVAVILYEKRRKASGYYIQEQEEGIRILRITREMAEKVEELKQLYQFENLRQRADDLNQLYVALTRAKEEMYVVGVHSEEPQEPITFLPEAKYEPGPKPAVITRVPVFPPTLSPYHLTIRKPPALERAQEHLNLFEKKRGDLIHAVLREIEFIAEPLGPNVENAVTAAFDAAGGSFSREQIRSSVEGFVKQSGVMVFFAQTAGRRVLREQELCARDGKLFRADRIIVDGDEATVMDFKTGGEEREEEYLEQLKNYMTLVHEALRVHTVRGVLAYVDRQKMRMIG